MKRLLRGMTVLLAIASLFVLFAATVSANTTVVNGPFAGCTVDANRVVSCPAGYNQLINNPYVATGGIYYACGDVDVRCDTNGNIVAVVNNSFIYGSPYGTVVPLQNVVAVYPDSRYCDGIVYITNEGGNLINRCDNGARVYPVYPDYIYYR